MIERHITHVIKNSEDDIRFLCNLSGDWTPRSVNDVIIDIESGDYSYVTRSRGLPDKPIHIVNDNVKYLRTNHDGIVGNNLDELPTAIPEYIKNYPKDKSSNWSDSLQGVTHSNEFWFFTQETKLLKFHISTDLDTNSNSAQSIVHMPDDLSSKGYNHFGDPDYKLVNGQGYIFIPVEGFVFEDPPFPGGQLIKVNIDPVLAVFKDDPNLTYLGFSLLPNQTVALGTARAAWCAINPIDGFIYSSAIKVSDQFPIYRYSITFANLQQNMVNLTAEPDLQLHNNGVPISIPEYMQGGCFAPNGTLFLCSGKINDSKDGGIRSFNQIGQLIYRSKFNGRFEYLYNPAWPIPAQEPEGITYWDLNSLPQNIVHHNVEGQLHAILLNKELGKDHVYFKHYRFE